MNYSSKKEWTRSRRERLASPGDDAVLYQKVPTTFEWWSHKESIFERPFRKGLLYPFNYGTPKSFGRGLAA